MNSKILNKYIEDLIEDIDLLHRLERDTYIKTLAPQMISGKGQGKFLELLSKMISPQNILEIGTFTGYSTLCLAQGLKPEGKIITIDPNEEVTYIAEAYFNQSERKEQIILINGNAREEIPKLDFEFDLIFIDADKESYIHYFDLVIGKIRPGGIILADNILWSGKVLEENKDKKAQALDDFNHYVAAHPQVESVILPLRDGIHLIRKK
jgi:predicted O-methyltransferase YrrM